MAKASIIFSIILFLWISGSSYWYFYKTLKYCCSEDVETEVVLAKDTVNTEQAIALEETSEVVTDTLMLSTLNSMYLFQFADANYKLNSDEINYIAELQAYLIKYPKAKVLIEGHADSNGSDKANLKYSKLRAQSIMKLLIDKDIAQNQIELAYFGADQLINSSSDIAENMRLSRRVNLRIKTNN